MRFIPGMVLVLAWLAMPTTMQAADRDKAETVVKRAIKAHGGAEALNKTRKHSRSGQGTLDLQGGAPFKTEEIVSLPDRCHVDLDLGRARLILVLNGDKGWVQTGGKSEALPKEMMGERREEIYVWWLMTLTPLLKDGFTLKALDDAKVHGQDASVIKVSYKGHADARLYFDKKSGLLVKIARRGSEAGVRVNKEYYYSDHKEYDGVKVPGKELITINGAKQSEVKFSHFKTLDRIADKTFDKP